VVSTEPSGEDRIVMGQRTLPRVVLKEKLKKNPQKGEFVNIPYKLAHIWHTKYYGRLFGRP
jgi:hypothetical protein